MKRWHTILIGIMAGVAFGEGVIAVGGPFWLSWIVLGVCVFEGIVWPLQ